MKIVLATMIWKRHEVFKIWAQQVLALQNDYPLIDILALVAGSEGKRSQNLVHSYGFYYIETPNQPLGNKANLRLKACKNLQPDYVLFLGSDDIVSAKAFGYILARINEGFEQISSTDLYYYDTASKRVIYSAGYINHRAGEPMAVGRCVSARVLDALDWRLWKKTTRRGLDGSARDRLESIFHRRHVYRHKDAGGMVLDIKNEDNITLFKMRPNYTEIPLNQLHSQFDIADQLISL